MDIGESVRARPALTGSKRGPLLGCSKHGNEPIIYVIACRESTQSEVFYVVPELLVHRSGDGLICC